MKNVSRTWLGVALFVPLAAVLLTTYACLPAPVGDPETSKVDASLVGAWMYAPAVPNEMERSVALIKPWDGKTYLVQVFYYAKAREPVGKEQRVMTPYKAWLTQIGGATFLTCESLGDWKKITGGPAMPPTWAVMRLDKTEQGYNVRVLSFENELLKGAATREQLEAVIRTHVENPALYVEPKPFRKLGKEDQPMLEEFLNRFGTQGIM